jgi:hypothetical protein
MRSPGIKNAFVPGNQRDKDDNLCGATRIAYGPSTKASHSVCLKSPFDCCLPAALPPSAALYMLSLAVYYSFSQAINI